MTEYPKKKKNYNLYGPNIRWVKKKGSSINYASDYPIEEFFYNKMMNPYGFLESKDFYYKEVKESPEKPKVYTKYNLILEKIENNENYTFGERDKLIRTLQYHLRTKTLLVGGEDCKVLQYKINGNTNKFETLRDFEDLGISSIEISVQVGDLVVFGGSKGQIRIINIHSQHVLKDSFETALKRVDSLKVCRGLNSKTFLVVGGDQKDDSKDFSDYLDLSLLVNNYDSRLDQIQFENLGKRERTKIFDYNCEYIRDQQEEINNLQKSILQANC